MVSQRCIRRLRRLVKAGVLPEHLQRRLTRISAAGELVGWPGGRGRMASQLSKPATPAVFGPAFEGPSAPARRRCLQPLYYTLSTRGLAY